MNKVILLALIMPVTAFGQNMENKGFASVIISEIMADPSPVVELPNREYIELHNRTGDPANLKNWSLSDGNSNSVFPERIIVPGAFMIVCQLGDTALFNRYGKTIGLKSFPALTNEGKTIFIRDSKGALVHGVKYSSGWYGDKLKDAGGWSLEIIDTDYPFFEKGNWRASVSPEGGTPGKANSVAAKNRDMNFIGIENVFPDDTSKINIRFSETVAGLRSIPEIIEIEGLEIDTLFNSDPLCRSYTVLTVEPLKHGRIYTLRIYDKATDYAGNKMERNNFRFGLTEPAGKGDILFNELLFNPWPEEPDFIEFYNNSERVINASSLLLVSVNDESHDTSSVFPVSAENRCVIPRNYIVITSSKEVLANRFTNSDPANIFEVSSLPSMPDDRGHLVLFNRSLEKIDEVFYDDEMHYSLLGGNEGISLEKVTTNGNSAERSQWHSASESAGWGTPGAPNSVLSENPESVNRVVLSSTKITPDNDGNEDILVIHFMLGGPGSVITVNVFDETGRFVKRIADNLLAGPESSVVWNGTAADEKLVSTGIYILLISLFDDTGKTQKWKKVCTVIR